MLRRPEKKVELLSVQRTLVNISTEAVQCVRSCNRARLDPSHIAARRRSRLCSANGRDLYIRSLTVAIAVLLAPGVSGAQSWTDHVVDGLYGPPHNETSPDTTGGKFPYRAHDALAAGMPTHWAWSRGAIKGSWNNFKMASPNGLRIPILTGRFGDAAPNTHGKNYRAHVRNYELWYFGTTDRKWKLLDRTTAKGGYYTKSGFVGTGAMPGKIEPDGSVSFAPKADNWQHFYTGTVGYAIPQEPFLYLHARAQLKLSGPDAEVAKVLGNVGIDKKSIDPVSRKSNNTGIVPAALQAAMRYVTHDYVWFTATTMTSEEIRADPPPAPSDWLGSGRALGQHP